MMNSNSTSLKNLLTKWSSWSETADKSENGWPSDFPEWQSIISMAGKLMEQPDLSEEEFRMVEQCWELSEEGETLADYTKENLDGCWGIILKLVNSRSNDVRWQVYEVLGFAGIKGEPLLREAIKDENSYCRRRAILSLAKLHPKDAATIAERFSNDPDSYVRQAAKELLTS